MLKKYLLKSFEKGVDESGHIVYTIDVNKREIKERNRTMKKNSNEEMKMVILDRLNAVEFTHVYAFAIREDKMVKAVIVENADEIMPLITYCERNSKSHGGVWGVRMWNAREAFEVIKEYAREIIPMCSVKEFEAIYTEHKANGYSGNRGNLFEDMFADFTNGTQNEDPTAKCTECGDVVVNGEHIQCKFWNATVTTEPQVNRFYLKHLEKVA